MGYPEDLVRERDFVSRFCYTSRNSTYAMVGADWSGRTLVFDTSYGQSSPPFFSYNLLLQSSGGYALVTDIYNRIGLAKVPMTATGYGAQSLITTFYRYYAESCGTVD